MHCSHGNVEQLAYFRYNLYIFRQTIMTGEAAIILELIGCFVIFIRGDDGCYYLYKFDIDDDLKFDWPVIGNGHFIPVRRYLVISTMAL